ncbi:MAG: hypothetical protein CSA79_04580 [Thiothrix nivea]|nr:MAG: hypothetical protein CSA79_04580 [Thiothrix nivea]
MKVAIAVLVKTPGLSPVKTRLAATLGHQQAEAFFHLAKAANEAILTRAVALCAEQGIELAVYWAVGETAGLQHPLWQSETIQRMHTGHGGLGKRMHYVYSTLLENHQAVILMGMDSPQNSAEHLLQVAQLLRQSASLLIGPARDGGFYLFAGNITVPLPRWTAVEYGCEDTLENLRVQLAAYRIRYLEAMTDVDTESDLRRMVAEMTGALLPEQRDLVDFIARL